MKGRNIQHISKFWGHDKLFTDFAIVNGAQGELSALLEPARVALVPCMSPQHWLHVNQWPIRPAPSPED